VILNPDSPIAQHRKFHQKFFDRVSFNEKWQFLYPRYYISSIFATHIRVKNYATIGETKQGCQGDFFTQNIFHMMIFKIQSASIGMPLDADDMKICELLTAIITATTAYCCGMSCTILT